MGIPVTVVTAGGIAVTEALNGLGLAVTPVAAGGLAVTSVLNGGLPVTGLDAGSNVAPNYRMRALAGSFVFSGEQMTVQAGYSMTAQVGAFAFGDPGTTKLTPPTPATTTLDPVVNATSQTLSPDKLRTTGDGGNGMSVSAASHTTGKYYCEVTVGPAIVNTAIGVCLAGRNPNTYLTDSQTAGVGYGGGWAGSAGVITTSDTTVVNHVYGLAVDLDNRTMWLVDITLAGGSAAGHWNANATANPATNVNGATMIGSLVAPQPIVVAVSTVGAGTYVTMNFGATAYALDATTRAALLAAGYVNW